MKRILKVSFILIPALALMSCSGAAVKKEESSFGDYAAYSLYCLQQNMTEDALVVLREAEQKYPRKAELYNNLAVCYEKKGEYALAGEYYQKALSLSPSSTHIRKNYERFKTLGK